MFDSSQACCADEIAQIWNEIETTKKQQLSSKTEQLEAKRKYTDYQKLENELEDSKVKCTLYERKIQDLEDERASLLTTIRLLSEDHKDLQLTKTAVQEQPKQQWKPLILEVEVRPTTKTAKK